MQVLTLAHYNLKRIARQKNIAAMLIAVPLFLLALIFAGKASVILSILICSAATSFAMAIQHVSDSSSNFLKSIQSSPAPKSTAIIARIVSGWVICLLQMAVLLVPSAII